MAGVRLSAGWLVGGRGEGRTVRHLELKSGGDLTRVLSHGSHVAAWGQATLSKFRNKIHITVYQTRKDGPFFGYKIRFLQDSHEFKRMLMKMWRVLSLAGFCLTAFSDFFPPIVKMGCF